MNISEVDGGGKILFLLLLLMCLPVAPIVLIFKIIGGKNMLNIFI
jgi:hypothetical protein